ncbi:MAG: hypothetical protein ABII26_12420 [Pseudomonadota bacterium]
MDAVLLWIGANFTEEVYLFYTKLQGIIWSAADICLVFFVLKVADLARAKERKRKILWRYISLWISAALTPFLLLTKTKNEFFTLESIICGIQFSILVYTLISERKITIKLIREII